MDNCPKCGTDMYFGSTVTTGEETTIYTCGYCRKTFTVKEETWDLDYNYKKKEN